MAAPWKWCEAGSSFLNKLAQNGDGYCSSVHTRNWIVLYDDLLLAWNQKEQNVLAVSVKNNAVNKEDYRVLVLTEPPAYEVDNVLANRTHHLLLWGPRGVTVVQLSKAVVSAVKQKAVCRSWPIGEHFFQCNKSIVLTNVAWHPDSVTDGHVLILTSDNHLRLYSLLEPQAPQLILPVGVGPGLSSSIGASLGEDTAVSFDFGHQLENTKSRQVFILMGSGDVYLTHVSPTDENSTVYSGRVLGPLNMRPPSEDNYGVDGYSLLCLPAPVPLLVIATTAGTLYHCLALGMPQQQPFNQSLLQEEVDMALFVFEKVKLDLTFTPGNEDDAFTCPIRLTRDPTCPVRYICSHNSGLHAVALPLVDHLHNFAQSEENATVPPQLRNEPCIVESLICTRPTTSSLPTPLVGAIVLPRVPGPVLIVLTASWKVIVNFLVQGYDGYVPQLFSSVPPSAGAQRQERTSFEQQVQQMLGSRTIPQLAQGTKECSAQECMEILFAATQKFREEWLQRLESCQVLITRRMQTVNMQKEQQLEKQEKLKRDLEQMQMKDTLLREKYDTAYGMQQKIIERVENVLHQLQQRVPQLSSAEQAMKKELETMEEHLKGMESSLEQAQLKQDYQERHVISSTTKDDDVAQYISNTQIENIHEALSAEGRTISKLVQKVAQLKRELSL